MTIRFSGSKCKVNRKGVSFNFFKWKAMLLAEKLSRESREFSNMRFWWESPARRWWCDGKYWYFPSESGTIKYLKENNKLPPVHTRTEVSKLRLSGPNISGGPVSLLLPLALHIFIILVAP